MKVEIPWRQQARQMTFLRACGLSYPFEGGKPQPAQAKVIGYGGAAGGGKSDALIVLGIIACITYAGCNVGFFRRKFTQLEGPGGGIMRSRELLANLINKNIVKWNGTTHRWTFINGSIMQFCHLQHEDDVYNYQSQQFDVILFDEATHFTRTQYRYMLTRNRSTCNIPRPFFAMGTNPGNVGHLWFKNEFVYAGEPEKVHLVQVEEGQYEEHLFIPAFLTDNQALEDRDPEYRKNLMNQPEHIRRQLLSGDWEAVDGAAFSEWRNNVHVIKPFEIPDDWIRIRSIDWGYAKPYAVGWYAVDYDGRLYKYRELYGWGGEDDVGTKETPAEVARKIWELEGGEEESFERDMMRDAVADDAMFGGKQDDTKSIAEQFADEFLRLDREHGTKTMLWRPVGKGPRSRIQGKLEVHERLRIPVDEEGKETGEQPMLVFFSNCKHTIRCIPNLMVDEKNPEDVDTSMEDHNYDETRYACMSRPMLSKKPKPPKSRIQKHKERLAKRSSTRRVL